MPVVRKIVIAVLLVIIAAAVGFVGAFFTFKQKSLTSEAADYTVPEIDLSVMPGGTDEKYAYLYELSVVDDTADYLAHPDSVLLKNGDILTVYPEGHGKGAIRTKISTDGGKSWTKSVENTPESWKDSLETPTVYRLTFTDGKTPDKLILISANPKWPNMSTPGGFNCSVSTDEGKTWTEFERFYDNDSSCPVVPIVAMSSLTQLKENGVFVDKWMGLFHDSDFYNYKTILTFDDEGNMHWSQPEKYFSKYRETEKKAQMCEVEVIRSVKGQGGTLALIARSNSKKMNSLISFSTDEGETWSAPREVPSALNGERHKAEWVGNKLFITFRSINRGPEAIKGSGKKWVSEGWVAWVGSFEDLRQGTEGICRIKLAHIYNDGQTSPEYTAKSDTGYCGNVVLDDGTIVTSTYGKFSPDEKTSGGDYKTYICSKRINPKDIEEMIKQVKGE
jgi:hypothetical protein